MSATVTEIANDVFRINVMPAGGRLSFSCFLVRDEWPAMIETGFDRLYGMYDAVYEAISGLIDPVSLSYVFVPHFEPDECGALNRFLALAPQAEAVCSPIGATVTLPDFAIRPPRALEHEESLSLGRKTLRAVVAPWVHVWDSMLVYDETDRVLFTSDLFGQGGDRPPVEVEDLSSIIVEESRNSGVFPSQKHLER
ncbi:MAG TPA: hypothetical protein VFY10_12120, partial [Dehalococcoidia bacterium]|nr:hypothetical protein [Dehalococcoidia bacterium]